MIEFMVFAALGFAALLVIGTLLAGLWLVLLPFRLLGWVFRGLGLLIFLPVLLLGGILGVAVFGLGALGLALPFLPFALIVFVLWRLARRPRSAAVSR